MLKKMTLVSIINYSLVNTVLLLLLLFVELASMDDEVAQG